MWIILWITFTRLHNFMDKQKVWENILNHLRNELPLHNFRAWFSNTDIKDITEEKITIIAPSAFISEQLKARYLPKIEEAAAIALGKKVDIEFIVDPTRALKKRQKEEQVEEEGLFTAKSTQQTPILNPKYNLENFVVGLSNNVAYAAAQAVVQNLGTAYNPLFFYGGTGVGKTHLMLGIGNTLLQKNPNLKVIYCSSEKLTNDYVEAIQTRRMGDFRHRYRSVDLLLIDDVQFLSGKEGTQEEFFHTFNELVSRNSQIVLTSDKPPHEIAKLEDRLKSRFQGGLMIDIQLPDFDTRVAILKAKAHERGEEIPEESLNIIAQAFETNARELEGKLIQIIQTLKIQNKTPDPDTLREHLGQASSKKIQNISYKHVLSTICEYFNIKMSDLVGPKRQKGLVLPRHLAMHILTDELNMTVEKVGEILGNRDHTTVMHGRDKIKKLITSDREIQKTVIEVKQQIITVV